MLYPDNPSFRLIISLYGRYWHMLYTPNPTIANGDYRTWQIFAARSKDLSLESWDLLTLTLTLTMTCTLTLIGSITGKLVSLRNESDYGSGCF